jgi:hypothetical protein
MIPGAGTAESPEATVAVTKGGSGVIRPSGGFRIAEGGPLESTGAGTGGHPLCWRSQPERPPLPGQDQPAEECGRVFLDLPVGSYWIGIMEILLSLSITIDEPLELCVSMPINSLP